MRRVFSVLVIGLGLMGLAGSLYFWTTDPSRTNEWKKATANIVEGSQIYAQDATGPDARFIMSEYEFEVDGKKERGVHMSDVCAKAKCDELMQTTFRPGAPLEIFYRVQTQTLDGNIKSRVEVETHIEERSGEYLLIGLASVFFVLCGAFLARRGPAQ